MTEDSLITAALGFGTPAERAAFLDQACAGNPELRDRVERGLRERDKAGIAREQPVIDGDRTIDEYTTDGEEDAQESEGKTVADASTAATAPERPILGKLGPYELLEDVGRGGMGMVVRARDPKLNRIVAVKLLAPSLIMNPKAVQRFLREAQAAAMVRHDNVVTIYTVDEIEKVPFLIMEFIEGQSLDKLIDKRGALSVEEVVRIGMQVALGLAAAHNRKLVHRDVKPGNILLEEADGRVKITDFGLARAAEDITLTNTGNIAGTPQYMSPEQAQGDPVDHRSDLFSLGSVMYAMCAGRAAFRAESAVAILRRVCDTSPTPIRELNPNVPEWLVAIIDKLMAKQPADRFQTAAEVAEVLSRHLCDLKNPATLPQLARLDSSPASVATIPDATRLERVRNDRDKQFRSATRVVWATVVLVGCFVAWWFWSRMIPSDKASTTNTRTTNAWPPIKPAVPPLAPKFINNLGMEFALIPKGNSWLGGGGGKVGDKPIEFQDDFYLGVYEVTQGEWEQVMGPGQNPSHFSRTGQNSQDVAGLPDAELKRFPVDSVSWDDCQEFIRRLNEKVREDGWRYRLPTSDEWEYACRCGPMENQEESGFDFYFDNPTNTLPPDRANFKESGGNRTRKVGTYLPSRLGLYDMHGNVFELCDDVDLDEGQSMRRLRGGGWLDELRLCRAGHISLGTPSDRYNGSGLRLARVANAATARVEKRLTFQRTEQRLPMIPSAGLALGDLDKDGDLDLFVAGLHAPCAVWLNDNRGRFADSGQALGNNASFAVALGDLDGDGDLDAFVCNSDDQRGTVWINDGRGRFEQLEQGFEPNRANDVALGDVDGDGDLDAMMSDFGGQVLVWINDGRGRFGPGQRIASPENTGLALDDFDGDGDLDCVITRFGGDNRILTNDGLGHFIESERSLVQDKSSSVSVADLDKDGDLDLYITAHTGDRLWFNDGRGSFKPGDQVLGTSDCEAVALADLDGDGDVDAITIPGGWVGNRPRLVWLNDGRGHFEKGPTLSSAGTQSLVVGDVDGDGDADVLFGNLQGSAELWLNDSGVSTVP